MNPPKPGIVFFGLLLALAALAAGVLGIPLAARWYFGLRYPPSPKPRVGSTVWSAPPGAVGVTRTGAADSMPAEPPLPRSAATSLRNPVSTTAESVEMGRKLFGSYCAACHGPEGKGDGPVAAKAIFPPPDLQLTTGRRTDGYIYATIRNGGAIMPPLGHLVTPAERWHIVNFVRSIAAAPAAPETKLTEAAPSPLPPSAATAEPAATAAGGDPEKGREVFAEVCSMCHSADSDEEIVGPSLKNLFRWPPHRGADGSEHAQHTAPMIRRQIVEGSGSMPPMGQAVSGQALDDLIAYLQTL